MANTPEPVMVDHGIAPIKHKYLVTDHVPTLALDYISTEDKQLLESDNGAASCSVENQSRPSFKRNKKKAFLKGQNKNRGPTFQAKKDNLLCPKLSDIPVGKEIPMCSNINCPFLHDISAYLASKPVDISEVCYVFDTYGYCPRGLTCRFSKSHITDNGCNIRKSDQVCSSKSKNTLSKELQISLRKRSYCFKETEKFVHELERRRKKFDLENSSDAEEVTSNVSNQKLGYSDDSDLISFSPDEKKKIDWKNKLILSPLTTVGNLPFRRICKQYGADITCGEMALAISLLQGAQQEWALVKRHESEDIFGVQLCGNNAYIMSKCAQLLQENVDVDFVDVNLGCPIDLIYQQGAGCSLLTRSGLLRSMLKSMNHVLHVPLTVKTRTGISKDNLVAHKRVNEFVKCGVSLISIHGRTREQRYTKLADWDYINQCAEVVEDVPVFGNGDILSYEEYYEKLEKYPRISGALLARGALYKPWLFSEIKERRHWDISSSERMDIIKKYVNYGLEHWGSDDKGVENTRRFLLEWMSFLHRYIPVGLLERLPQRINQRPPMFRGRDELETLFASPNCKDWIKISEMLLGPVPESFHFLPKHKASSWK